MLMKKNKLSKTQNIIINLGAFTTVPVVYALGANLSKKCGSVPMFIGTVALTIATPISIQNVSTKILEKKKEKEEE